MSSTRSTSHPYLADRQYNAIESWTASVLPSKRQNSDAEEIDPAVQAYLQMKMALFQRAAALQSGGQR
jgi:hypothetical protein